MAKGSFKGSCRAQGLGIYKGSMQGSLGYLQDDGT